MDTLQSEPDKMIDPGFTEKISCTGGVTPLRKDFHFAGMATLAIKA
jgi:hypothetical protein